MQRSEICKKLCHEPCSYLDKKDQTMENYLDKKDQNHGKFDVRSDKYLILTLIVWATCYGYSAS
jgi:hypothetical protein